MPPYAAGTVLRLRQETADELARRAAELEDERELFAQIALDQQALGNRHLQRVRPLLEERARHLDAFGDDLGDLEDLFLQLDFPSRDP